MAFKLLSELPNETEEQKTFLLSLSLENIVAYDPEVNAELHSSRGRSRASSGHSYFIRVPNGRTQVRAYGRTGWRRDPDMSPLGSRIKAWSEREARDLANEALTKRLPKFQQNPDLYRPDTPEEVELQRVRVIQMECHNVLVGIPYDDRRTFWFYSANQMPERPYHLYKEPVTTWPVSEHAWRYLLYRGLKEQPIAYAWIILQDDGKRLVAQKAQNDYPVPWRR